MSEYLSIGLSFLAAVFVIYLWWVLKFKAIPYLEGQNARIAEEHLRTVVGIAITQAAKQLGDLPGTEKMSWVLKELKQRGLQIDEKYVEFVYQNLKGILPGVKEDVVTPS